MKTKKLSRTGTKIFKSKVGTGYLSKKKSSTSSNLSGSSLNPNIIYWIDNPTFSKINALNKTRLILNKHNAGSQFGEYNKLLSQLLKYNNYSINLDFITEFYKHIYIDIAGSYKINITDTTAEWETPANSAYKITKRIPPSSHENTTILFLENAAGRQKVLKVFNNLDVDPEVLPEYLSLEVNHIGKDRSGIATGNYINFKDMDTFNIYNFNMIDYTIPEVRPDSHVYLSCRNNDAINDYIVNLVINHIKVANRLNKLRFVKYDNLFITKIKTAAGTKYRYCIIMDKYDGSLDSFFKKNMPATNETNNYALIINCLKQAEYQLNLIKGPDYLFTHTDMKLENLFYKLVNGKPVIYLADFDKSSISLHGIRFYNDIRTNPNTQGMGTLFNKVKSTGSYFQLDTYTQDNYIDRKRSHTQEIPHYYRLSRIISKHLPFELEQFYMRYSRQPYYTSFDMISLILSFFYYKLELKMPQDPLPSSSTQSRPAPAPAQIALISLDYNKLSKLVGLNKIILKYMTPQTYKSVVEIYASQPATETYDGNFGKLLAPLIKSGLDNNKTHKIRFIHLFDYKRPNIISNIYLTYNNHIALSLPIHSEPNIVQQLEKKYNELEDKFIEKYPFLIRYFHYFKKHPEQFRINRISNSKSAKSNLRKAKLPDFIIKTDLYKLYENTVSVLDWDTVAYPDTKNIFQKLILSKKDDITPIIETFSKLEKK